MGLRCSWLRRLSGGAEEGPAVSICSRVPRGRPAPQHGAGGGRRARLAGAVCCCRGNRCRARSRFVSFPDLRSGHHRPAVLTQPPVRR